MFSLSLLWGPESAGVIAEGLTTAGILWPLLRATEELWALSKVCLPCFRMRLLPPIEALLCTDAVQAVKNPELLGDDLEELLSLVRACFCELLSELTLLGVSLGLLRAFSCELWGEPRLMGLQGDL